MAVTFDLGSVQGAQGVPGIPGAKGDPGERGERGVPGADGVSPVITGSKAGKVTTLTITDAESPQGRTLATILDGEDGQGSGDMTKAAYDPDGDVLAEGGIPAYVEAHATQEETDPVFTASPAHDITAAQITEWDGLQEQIDAITSQSDVIDIVDTKAALNAYAEPVYKGDIVKVLADESNGGAIAYYRVGGSVEPPARPEPPYTWVYIGAQGPYYTKSETNTLLAAKQPTITASGILKGNGSGNVSAATAGTDYVPPSRTVNGKALSSDVSLTGTDIAWGDGHSTKLDAKISGMVDDISNTIREKDRMEWRIAVGQQLGWYVIAEISSADCNEHIRVHSESYSEANGDLNLFARFTNDKLAEFMVYMGSDLNSFVLSEFRLTSDYSGSHLNKLYLEAQLIRYADDDEHYVRFTNINNGESRLQFVTPTLSNHSYIHATVNAKQGLATSYKSPDMSIRSTALVSSESTPGANGEINWVYG